MKTVPIINILRTILPKNTFNFLQHQYQKKQLKNWKENGCPIPPPLLIKRNIVTEYQQKYKYNTFIETGTYLGDMVEFHKKRFKQIISIELEVNLFEKARKRFRNDKNITIVQGDSGKVLPEILNNINEPVIFFLDGHYSGGETAKGDKVCPIYEELNAILNSKINHIILIDDANLFIGNGEWPKIDELTKYVKSRNEKYQVEINDDIIRFYNQESLNREEGKV